MREEEFLAIRAEKKRARLAARLAGEERQAVKSVGEERQAVKSVGEEKQAARSAERKAAKAGKRKKEAGEEADENSDGRKKGQSDEAGSAAVEQSISKWNEWAAAPEAAPSTESLKDATSSTVSDQRVCCRDCSVEFVLTAAEQIWLKSKGYDGSKSRCAECTRAKKARFGEATGKGSAAADRASRTTCFTCGEAGHSSKQCKKAPCFNCGELGHQSKDCKQPRDNRAGGGVCFKFQSGACSRGSSCRFAHILESVC